MSSLPALKGSPFIFTVVPSRGSDDEPFAIDDDDMDAAADAAPALEPQSWWGMFVLAASAAAAILVSGRGSAAYTDDATTAQWAVDKAVEPGIRQRALSARNPQN